MVGGCGGVGRRGELGFENPFKILGGQKTVYLSISRLIFTSALCACLRCAAGGHFVSAGGSLRSPGVTLVNYKGDNISEYVCPTVLIDITRKITKFVNLKIFDA